MNKPKSPIRSFDQAPPNFDNLLKQLSLKASSLGRLLLNHTEGQAPLSDCIDKVSEIDEAVSRLHQHYLSEAHCQHCQPCNHHQKPTVSSSHWL